MNHKSLWLAGFVMLLLSCLAIDFVADLERSRIEQILRARVSDDSSRLISQLEKELNSNIYLVSGLVAYIYAEPELDDGKTQVALKALYEFGNHLRNVGAAPNNRIAHIHPLAGNEKAIGLNYRDVPSQWPAVERVIESRKTVVTGPIDLVQGGTGLVSRTPVFLADGSYWGLLSLVMDFDSLLAGAGIAPEIRYLKLAMRSFEGDAETGSLIMGDPALFDSKANAVIQTIAIPGAQWQLAAMPINGWQARQEFIANMEIIAMVIALCFIAGFLHIQRSHRNMSAAKKRMEIILQTTQEAIIVFDDDGIVSESNAAAERLFGYPRAEIQKLNIRTFMRQANRTEETADLLREISGDGQTHLSDVEAVKPNGTTIPLEINIGHTIIDGGNKHICAARDISVRKAAEEILMELATTDELTGLMNRRSIMKSAAEIFATSRRRSRPLAVMMIDADHFKRINDTYGHDAGDKVLIAFAACIRGNLRTADLLGRFGGEELIVVMPEATLDEAEAIAARMLDRVRNLRVVTASGMEISFTVSIGISSMDANIDALAEMIQIADSALYAAKNGGRDRYSVSRSVQKPAIPITDTGLQDIDPSFERKAV